MEPTEIVQFREHLKEVWARTHEHWRSVIDKWYWGTAPIWPEESERSVYMPSTARAIIEHASDTQLPWEPKFHRTPVGTGLEAEQDADAVEAGSRAVFFDAMLKNPELSFKQAGKHIVMYGYAVVYGPFMDFEDRPEEPKREDFESGEEYEWAVIDYKNSRKSWNPIRILAPHPASVLLDPSERQPKTAVRHDYMYRKHIIDLLNQMRERERKPDEIMSKEEVERTFGEGDPYHLVEITEFWSKTEHRMVFDSMPLFSEKNLLGFVPFNHAFSGFGMRATNDTQNDPFYLAQGLLDPVLHGLKTQAQAMSAKQNALIERSYLRIMTKGDAAELAEQLAEEGGILEGDEKEVAFLKYPELERTLFQIGSEIDDDIQLGTFVSDVAGVRQQGVSTVGQQAILQTAATRKFANPSKQLNMMATVVGQNVLKLVDRYGEAIEVGGKKLDPKQIRNDYNLVAEFESVDPILQLQMREIGLREVQEGVKSDESYRENDMRVADETLETKRLIKQQVRKSPEYLTAIAREVAKEDGMLDVVENMRNAEEGMPEGGGSRETPQISDQAGGGAPRAMRQMLTGDTANPPRVTVPPGGV